MKEKLQVSHLIILCLVLSCSGCSVVTFAYNYADWILLWKIDTYFDVTPQQKEFLKHQVDELHHWHRTSELPLYIGFLNQIQKDVQSGLSPEKLDLLMLHYQELRSHLAQKLAFHGTPFLINLKPEQQRFFRAVLQKENQELRVELGSTPEERFTNRMETVMDLLEYWVGEVSTGQRLMIQRWIRTFPDTTEDYLRYREFRQQQFLNILKHKTKSEQTERAVAQWMNEPGQNVPQHLYAGIQLWQNAVKAVILEMDRIVTSSQRQYMVNKLQTLVQTMKTLTRA